MLYVSLSLSLLLLLIAIRAAYRSSAPIWTVTLSAIGLSLGGCLLSFAFLGVWLQSLLLVLAVLVWRGGGWRPRSFATLACAATVVAYGVVGWFPLRDTVRLREKFPYASMEGRLPPPKALVAVAALPQAADERLSSLEEMIERPGVNSWAGYRHRTESLQRLHEQAVEAFVNQPGFGVGRMPLRGFSEWSLNEGLRKDPPLPQPGPRHAPSSSTGTPEERPPMGGGSVVGNLSHIHEASVADFVNPSGFGFFKDRRHVAGFQEHRFSKVPALDRGWTLNTLDLVGIALHDEPAVYVSANLPRMDELRTVPTRLPDDFEAAGLAALRGGEDLFVRETAYGLRVLGSLRSAKQCVACHGGQRGDLLGAFSYTFALSRK